MIRKILFFLFLVLVFIAVGIAIFILTFDLNDYRRFAEEKLSAALNRPVKIESMEMKLAFVPTIKIQGFQVGNPEELSSEVPLFKIEHMETVLELAPLLASNINIREVMIQSAELNLINKNGVNNWTFSAKKDKTEKGKQPELKSTKVMPNIHMGTIDLDSLVISYKNDTDSHKINLQKLSLTDFHVLSGNLMYKGHTIKIDLNTGRLGNFLEQKPKFPIDLRAELNRSNIRFNGEIGDLKNMSQIKMTITGNVPNPVSLARVFNIKSPYIPSKATTINASLEGNTKDVQIKQLSITIGKKNQFNISASGKIDNLSTNPYLSLNGQVVLSDDDLTKMWGINSFTSNVALNVTKDRLNVSKFHTEADRSDVDIVGSIMFDTLPTIDATITSEYFNIHDFIKRDTTAKNNTSSEQKKSVSSSEVPWNLLEKANATVKIGVKNIIVPDDIKGYVQLNTIATLKKGKLDIPFEINILRGLIKGIVDMEQSSQTITAQIQGRDLQLDDIRMLSKNIQNVQLDTDISLTGSGQSLDKILSSTNGQLVAELSKGYIINEWFVKLPQTLNLLQKPKTTVSSSSPDNRMPLLCGAANLNIKDGMIQSRDQLALETDALNFVIDGSVDLVKQEMDISMKPSLNHANRNVNATLTAAQVVRISGPFTNLTPGLNTSQSVSNLVQTGLQIFGGEENQQLTAKQMQTMLCTKALGGYQLTKKKKTARSVQPVATTTSQMTQPVKKEFKQQLLDSLSQALQSGAQVAY